MKLITLKKRGEFQRVAGIGHKQVSKFFVLQAAPRCLTPDHDPSWGVRFGFIITRKTGPAVKRNRIRRRFRAALGEILKSFPTEQGPLDVVLIPRQASFDVPFEILKDTLAGFLKRAGCGQGSSTGSPPQ